MFDQPFRDSARSSRLQARLVALADAVPDVVEAVLSTEDGFEVASIGRSSVSPAKVAAMTSSLHAVGATMSDESGLAACRNVIVEAAAGTIVIVRIATRETALLLTIVGRHDALLGTLLFASREFAAAAAKE